MFRYNLTRTISLPNRTVLTGALTGTLTGGASTATTLLFELSGPPGEDFSHLYNQSAAVEARNHTSII